MDEMIVARARLAMKSAIRGWLFDPNVSLIGLGWKEKDEGVYTGRLSIRFHVRKKLSGPQLESADTVPIPRCIGDFETDVPEGEFKLHYWGWPGWERPSSNPRARQNDPLVGGISIGNERQNGYGTLGTLVRDRDTGDMMCLSAWHVLVGSWGYRQGQRIYQPGRGDGGSASDTIATLERNAISANYDAAVAKLTGSRDAINNQLGLGSVTGIRQPELDMQVVKSGRQSSVTYGRITDFESVYPMLYSGHKRAIRDVFMIDARNPGEEVSAGGDSGSLWLEESSNCAVGLHFAGQNQPELALAMDIRYVLEALNVELVL
ncbi:MAG: S1 family peptidase [Anaerolineales bacterium]|jgi:endonuclease G|nr:S1 family peptidase [Anaerolineales bacterium]